jgi:uncharacterized membrane protein
MPQRLHWSGYLLGFALGGFFDGVLLHQILQWHHLLSGLEGEAFRDIRWQVLADGLFHALMYIIAAVGLWLLWRSRREIAADDAGRLLIANVLIGFGTWHTVDAVLSHWVLGIHRIRMDSDNPLIWDLIWFTAFGLVPLAIGVWLRRAQPPKARGPIAASVLAAAVLSGGAWSSLPPPNVSQVMVYFGPGAQPHTVIAAAMAVDARLVWSDGSGELWVFDLPDVTRASQLYRHGAFLVGSGSVSLGCLSWSRAI